VNRIKLWELRSPEVKAYLAERDTILIPVGSTEQHGDHLPVGVDALVAIHLAEDAARRANVLVAPPLWFGFAPQHMGFAGTVTLRPETLTAVVEDVCNSLIYHGFRKLVIVNGHRIANLPPLQIAASKVHNRTGAHVGIVDPVYIGHELHREILSDPEAGGLSHAEGLETAHMLHLHPDLVAEEEITLPKPTGHPAPPFHIVDPFQLGDRVVHMSAAADTVRHTSTGAGGNPTWGTAEKGRRLHEGLVDRLVTYLKELESYQVTDVIRHLYPI
jgi:creatinine amidohydrolase